MRNLRNEVRKIIREEMIRNKRSLREGRGYGQEFTVYAKSSSGEFEDFNMWIDTSGRITDIYAYADADFLNDAPWASMVWASKGNRLYVHTDPKNIKKLKNVPLGFLYIYSDEEYEMVERAISKNGLRKAQLEEPEYND